MMFWLLSAAAGEAHEAAPPLIDVDGTVVLQFVLFLVTLVLLRTLVFKPFLQAREEREDQIDGQRARAQEMEALAQTKWTDYEARLEKAKHTAEGERIRMGTEARSREREILDRSHAETSRLIEEQRKTAQVEGERARQRLRADIPLLAHRLASRVLGREIT